MSRLISSHRPGAVGWLILVVAGVAMLLVACSSDESGGSGGEGVSEATSGGGGESSNGAGGDGTLPLGAAWETFAVADFDGQGGVSGITTLGDTAWITGTRWNAPVLWRSTDAETWEEIAVAAPDADRVSILGILERDGGGYLGFGHRSWDCYDWTDDLSTVVPPGMRALDMCRRDRPVIHLSDDGTSWRQVEPASMAPPGDHAVILESVSAYSGGYIGVGTVQGPDWHGRVWTSTDGEEWALAAEVRGADFTSLQQVVSDGEQIVVIGAEHQCGEPRDISQGGWNLGTAWLEELRIYQGTDPTALTLIEPGAHPLAFERRVVNCAEDSIIQLTSTPDGWAEGIVVGGRIVLVEREAPDDTNADETRVRRFVSLMDGEWVAEEVELPPISSATGWLVDVNGHAWIAGVGNAGNGLGAMWAVGRTDTSWEHRDAVNAVLWSSGAGATYFDGALLVAGRVREQLFSSSYTGADPSTVVIGRSVPTAASWNACTLEAGADCRYTTIELVGRTDFSGADLTGVDLTAADLQGGTFDGASFRDATLVGVRAHLLTSFVGTDFSGADLRGTQLGGVGQANFTGANLYGARVRFTDALTLEGARLTDAQLQQSFNEDRQFVPVELSLAGLDLRHTRISGPRADGAGPLVITSLRGAMVENTSFTDVDLSGADVTGVDLSQVRLDEHSLCPNGEVPSGESFRLTCE